MPGDYDGDGKTDFAVWRPVSAVWYVINSSNGVQQQQQFGLTPDIPVPADYDGDHKTDFAVWRPGTQVWHILNSLNGTHDQIQWGLVDDVPVPLTTIRR